MHEGDPFVSALPYPNANTCTYDIKCNDMYMYMITYMRYIPLSAAAGRTLPGQGLDSLIIIKHNI